MSDFYCIDLSNSSEEDAMSKGKTEDIDTVQSEQSVNQSWRPTWLVKTEPSIEISSEQMMDVTVPDHIDKFALQKNDVAVAAAVPTGTTKIEAVKTKEEEPLRPVELPAGLTIGGVRIVFPDGKKPFPPQIAVMSNAINALNKSQNALLESPTGTGKTLALLTSALSWQRASFVKATSEYEKLLAEQVQWDAKQSPDDSISQLESLPSTMEAPAICPKKHVIYYLSRTHTQLKQVINQMRAMHPSVTNGVTMTVLGSKEHLCVSQRARNFREEGSKLTGCNTLDDACKELRKRHDCGEYNLAKQAAVLLEKMHFHDIEEAVELGKKHHACAYFATRNLATRADIIFCPYNYVLDMNIRNAMMINLDRAIVIIDEGHNIADVCREAIGCEISIESLRLAAIQLAPMTKVGEIYSKLLHVTNGLQTWAQQKVNALSSLAAPHYNGAQASEMDCVFSVEEVLLEFERNFGLNPETLELYMTVLEEIMNELIDRKEDEAGATDAKDADEKSLNMATCNLLSSFFRVSSTLMRTDAHGQRMHLDDFKIIIELDRDRGSRAHRSMPNPRIQFLCLNAAIGFKEVASHAHSVLITSGTLSPMSSFAGELGTSFTYKVEAKHVIASRQLLAGAVGSFQGQSLESSFKFQSSSTYQDSVMEVLRSACSTVPRGSGTLVFFPSYALMDKLMQRWQETGAFDELSSSGDYVVFTEPRNSKECELVLGEYLQTVESRASKVILFCVCRGKVSEGLDFSDDKARLVILVGIPYPAAFDLTVRLKKEYQDKMSKVHGTNVDSGGLIIENGSQWYESQAWRAVNQAIGRCIRHRNDWGCILFLDPRFKYPRSKASLSKWIGGEVRDFDGYESMHLDLKLFLSDLTNKPPGGIIQLRYEVNEQKVDEATANDKSKESSKHVENSENKVFSIFRAFKGEAASTSNPFAASAADRNGGLKRKKTKTER